MADKVSRRDVLRGSAAAVAGMAFTGAALAKGQPQQRTPRGERLRVGIIGCGGKGWSGMQWAAESSNIVAICDVDAKNRSLGLLEHPKAATFEDYRHMIEMMHGDMDAVVISTPDHHHGPASAISMRAGLHCYCEKPLTRTIWEARQLQMIAEGAKVATQMGNQSTANTPMRKAAALIRNGEFGAAKEVHLWTDRAAGWWKQGIERPAPAKETPKTLDWDIWLGPRPRRPYAEGYHPFAWRGFWDFGTGSLGDMGCHIFNMPFMALDLRDPLSVQAKTSGHNRESFPSWVEVHYEFGANLAGRPALDVFWYDGGHKPAASLVPGEEYGGNGVIVVCEKATIYSPNSENNDFRIVGGGTMPDIQVDESPGHMEEFIRAASGGPPAVSNFPNYSGPLSETVLLGNLAIWADGPKVEWDAKTMTTKGTKEFDSLIRPQIDNGWGF
jgi:predicted dehydrogenase